MPKLEFQTLVTASEAIWAQAWIISDGSVWITKRQTFKFSCKMQFSRMPFDKQECEVPVQPHWADGKIKLVSGILGGKPLTVTPKEGVYLGGTVDWHLDTELSTASDVCEFTGFSDGSCAEFLKYVFVLVRSPSYYEKYTLIPMYFCVVMAWSSFFISRQAAPARVSLTAISFLTLLGRVNGILAHLPPLSGSVWLLDFLVASMCFCVYAIIEFAFANYLMRIEARIEKLRSEICKSEMCNEEQDKLKERVVSPRPAVPYASTPTHRLSLPREGQQQEDALPNEKESTLADVENQNVRESKYSIQAKIQKRAGRCDRWLVSRQGQLILRDQHLDVFSRWAYPIMYIVVVSASYAKVA